MSDATGNTVTILYTHYTGTSAVYSHVVHFALGSYYNKRALRVLRASAEINN